MKKYVLSMLMLTGASLWGGAQLGIDGALTLPGGGSSMRRLGGADVRVGWSLNDCWETAFAVGWQEDAAALEATVISHAAGWPLYDRFFGFSAFEPFLSFGAKGWIAEDDGQFGPKAGIGFFYYLDDHWAVRTEADMTLGLDSGVEAVFSVSAGVQYSF